MNDKGRGAREVNDAAAQDFVVDTGSENTVITRTTAQRLGVVRVMTVFSDPCRPHPAPRIIPIFAPIYCKPSRQWCWSLACAIDRSAFFADRRLR